MSSWLAALGPCASPKSKAKTRKGDGSLERPLNLSSLKRRGSLTDIRNSRKSTEQRSFREKLQGTFEGSLRKTKKAGSLEAVVPSSRSQTISNPDANMNLATSLSPKSDRSGKGGMSSAVGEAQDPVITHEKFWTNFYNTLPRNRQNKGDRPKDLSLQHLNETERQEDMELLNSPVEKQGSSLGQKKDGQWQAYATSPRTKRKNRTLERMNSAPSARKSPMRNYELENRPGSEGKASPLMQDAPEEIFDNVTNERFIVMPRSVSLQEEYWTHSKGGSKPELRKVSPSPDRIIIRDMQSPIHVQGHVWVKTKDGNHIELRAIERHPRDLPSPSESQTTDLSSLSYSTATSSVSNFSPEYENGPKFSAEVPYSPPGSAHSTTQTQDQYQGPYMSPEEYQANIFDLIQSLNQSPPNPGSPAEVRPEPKSEVRLSAGNNSPSSKTFTSQKFIMLNSTDQETQTPRVEGDDYVKREQPIFTVRAHVFQIDPETKKNWVPASKSSVAVSYYYDSARNTYRIISVEGSKAIINSTITPNMAFTKTSQKFGQWSDPRANTVYGLGFSTETDLAKFIEKFKEVKEQTRQQAIQSQSPTTVNGTGEESNSPTSSRESQTHPARGFFHARSSSLTSMREPPQQNEQRGESINLRERRNSFNTPGSNGTTGQGGPAENQIKYENDRLKLALAQSSANAKKWEIELQTLKNNNARLTAALQESTANVEEWKKQLAAYKDENTRMKKKVGDMEKKQGSMEQVSTLQEQVEQLQRDNQYKDEEVDRLQQRIAEMTAKEAANGNMQGKIKVGSLFRSSSHNAKHQKALEEENRDLNRKVEELQQLLQEYKMSQDNESQELLRLQDHLGSKITELYEFHEQIIATIRKESNS